MPRISAEFAAARATSETKSSPVREASPALDNGPCDDQAQRPIRHYELRPTLDKRQYVPDTASGQSDFIEDAAEPGVSRRYRALPLRRPRASAQLIVVDSETIETLRPLSGRPSRRWNRAQPTTLPSSANTLRTAARMPLTSASWSSWPRGAIRGGSGARTTAGIEPPIGTELCVELP